MSGNRIISASQRRKITIACQACRKRKARCSGTVPCTVCVKNKLECHFDTNRRRRGPRSRVTEDVNSSAHGSGILAALINPTPEVEEEAINIPTPTSAVPALEPPSQQILATRDRLKDLLATSTYEIDGVPQEVISHLLEIFFTVVNHQQLPLLSPEYGLDWFVDRESPLSLVIALCSLSVGYSSHESASNDQSPRLDERLVSACRLMLLKPGANNQYLDNMLSLCALASHEVNNGNGAQAWCDIGVAQSLASLISVPDLGELSQDIFRTAYDFLSWLQAGFVFGNPNLAPSISACSSIPSPLVNDGLLEDRHANIAEATKLLLNVVDYSSRDNSADPILPWHRGSKFMALRLSLDKFSIGVSENFDLDPIAFKSTLEDRSQLAVGALMALLRDCCSIILNRNLLPAFKHATESQNNRRRDTVDPPRIFVEGRINACEASAESIYEFCTILIANQIFFLPSFLGYCCFQAALVFLNSLERCKDESQRGEFTDKFKVIFMILGALRRFYQPANLWVEVLSKINQSLHKTASTLTQAVVPGQRFFSRFPCIREPPFITMTASPARNEVRSAIDSNTILPLPTDTQERGSGMWMENYRTRLKEQAEGLSPNTLQTPQATPAAEVQTPQGLTPYSCDVDNGHANGSGFTPGISRAEFSHLLHDNNQESLSNLRVSDQDERVIHVSDHYLDVETNGMALESMDISGEHMTSNAISRYGIQDLIDPELEPPEMDLSILDFSEYLALGELIIDSFRF